MAVPDIAQSNDTLLIQVDPGMTPMCTFVPRQLDKDRMMSLFPESWITKYEMLHQATKPIQSKDPLFIRKENGEVETKFLMAPLEKKDVTIFPTQIAMLQLVSYVGEDGLQIKAFREDGKPCYKGKSPSCHIWWNVCDCVDCQKEGFEEDYSKRKKKSSQQKLKERYEAGDPEVDILGEPSGRFDYYILYPRSKKQISPSPSKEDHNQNQKPPLIPYYQKILPQTLKCQPLPIKPTQISESSPCYMFDQASPSYSQNFLPLENFDHPQTNTKHV
ncbi:hypothetical protein RGQ29_009283 [Quercus rubra]|uniref:Uncharacterized protein n=1 Tax=Quercus rubra TaxID=3512 RepID=A0AAN7J4I8_QUERU|nr:hypothetical protein RGQ29_009283 [Quercus rubra]